MSEHSTFEKHYEEGCDVSWEECQVRQVEKQRDKLLVDLSQEQARGRRYLRALERIAKFTYKEGKTGDPLYLLEICQETAQEALAETWDGV